nr:transcription factor SRM1-like [Lolium perenne]
MWDAIAAAVPGKTPEDVRRHYELLVEDVDGIEAGRVPLLVYAGDAGPDDGGGSGGGGGKKGSGVDKGSSKSAEQERRKGIAWTEDEHRGANIVALRMPMRLGDGAERVPEDSGGERRAWAMAATAVASARLEMAAAKGCLATTAAPLLQSPR